MRGLWGRMAGKRLVRFPVVGARLSGGGDIFGAGLLQNILRPPDPLRVVAMNGNQNAALPYASVVPLRFIFRDTHTDPGAKQSADCASRSASERLMRGPSEL
jgi:hypothetical protein